MSTATGQEAGDEDLLGVWRKRFQAPVSGWNFDDLNRETTEETPPWSYTALAREHLRQASQVLDIGTGGGEVLMSLADDLPSDTVATEGWQPNVPIATKALASVGIEVVNYDAESHAEMPFSESRFDLVLNRHEAYDPTEVHRILRSGGRLVTQQVDGRNFEEARRLFGGSANYGHVTLENFARDAQHAGFVIERSEAWVGKMVFETVAALVRYFAMVPWEVPDDFSVDRYAEALLDLHRSKTPLVFTQRRFLLIARAR